MVTDWLMSSSGTTNWMRSLRPSLPLKIEVSITAGAAGWLCTTVGAPLRSKLMPRASRLSSTLRLNALAVPVLRMTTV